MDKNSKSGTNQKTVHLGSFFELCVGAAHIAFLASALSVNQANLNPDGIAYLRLAGYYADFKTSLMISGYWGPMLSWITAVWIKLGLPVLIAGRLTMAVSAVVYAWGARALLCALPLPRWSQEVGFALAALQSVFWSVEYISPDLLVSGLICFAAAEMLRKDWAGSVTRSVRAGLFWALGYLAKAVALPVSFIISLAIALLWHWRGKQNWRAVSKGLLITLSACLVLAAPWVAVLSTHYKRPTFSTAAAIAHAVVGPPDMERYHPYARQIHKPEPGRITSWEDPSTMAYNYWSPFKNARYFKHQLDVVKRNAATVLVLLGGFDLLHTGVIGLIGCIVLAVIMRGGTTRSWLLLPCVVLSIGLIYLPVYVQVVDQRYFYACYPALWGAVVAVVTWLGNVRDWLRRLVAWVFGSCAFVSFITPAVLGLMVALTGLSDPASECAKRLADKLTSLGIVGPVVGSGMVSGGRTGLYLAFLLGQPWYGDSSLPSVMEYAKSEARLVVVNRKEKIVTELDTNSVFKSLDEQLFQSEEEASICPVKIYELQR